ncbi:MAG: ketopantoate reductase family protein [Candidatus Altiarchaeota archaeon]
MKIGVVGPGAIGSLYAALLSANPGNMVWLVGRRGGESMQTLGAVARGGISVSGETNGVYRSIHVQYDAGLVGVCDLVLLTTKAYSAREAAQYSKPMVGDDTVFLILQNGLGQEDDVAESIPREQVIRGITMNGVLPLGPGRIIHAGRGETVIGALAEGQSMMLDKVKERFDDAGLPTRISSDIQGDVWLKTLVNAGINPVGALYKRTNGEIYDNGEAKTLCENAVSEGAAVAKALGVKLAEDPLAKTRAVASATYHNKNSMWMDLENARKTEIEAINGYIVREGRRVGVPTPVNEFLAGKVRTLESGLK